MNISPVKVGVITILLTYFSDFSKYITISQVKQIPRTGFEPVT